MTVTMKVTQLAGYAQDVTKATKSTCNVFKQYVSEHTAAHQTLPTATASVSAVHSSSPRHKGHVVPERGCPLF
jgi:hypothetical protein